MQPCDDCAHQKTADNARVERGDAEDRALARRKIRGIDNASRRKERAHHGIHAHVAQKATKRRGSLLGFGKAIGEANREDNRDVVHNDAGSGLENRKEDRKARSSKPGNSCRKGGAGKGIAKALKDAGDWQDQDRRHEDFAQALELCQQLIFVHGIPLLKKRGVQLYSPHAP